LFGEKGLTLPKAIAIVAHHDDHVLWMGGTIQRLALSCWQWTVVAMCVPDPTRQAYFQHCCSVLGVAPVMMDFQDYMGSDPFSRNDRDQMRSRLAGVAQGQTFELVFTHSRGEHGEYWARHANHVEVRELTAELVNNRSLGAGQASLAYFAYDVIYGSGTATCARTDATYFLPLTYPELLWKCQLCRLAPDAESSLRNLAYPCPNPEGFEGDSLSLPAPLVRRR
jgi:LmbE family N-acetylglucosaminyl deacetylase